MNTAAKPKFTKYAKLSIIVILLALIALSLYYFFKPKEAPPRPI
ncbi:hypothetical protein [Moraxella bovoculi]|nr:hypothetical protein [Moraxella bovoculi]